MKSKIEKESNLKQTGADTIREKLYVHIHLKAGKLIK